MAGTKNIYNSDPLEIVIEALELTNNLKLQKEYLDISVAAVDGNRTLVSVSPKLVDNYSPYVDPVNFIIDKLDLTARIPKDMCYSGQYPASFSAFSNFMLGSYGLLIKPGQWEIVHSTGTYPLTTDSTITADVTTDRQLYLKPVQAHPIFSTVMQFPLYVTNPQTAVSNLLMTIEGPTEGAVGDAVEISFKASGGMEPYVFRQLSGTLPVPLNGNGDGLSGVLSSSGPYDYVIEVEDAFGQTTQVSAFFMVTLDSIVADNTAPNGTVGIPYAHQYRLSGGVKPYRVVGTTNLPLGLEVTEGGYLHGLVDEGEYSYGIDFEDAVGSSFTLIDTIVIAARPIMTVRAQTRLSLCDWLELSAGYGVDYGLQSHPSGTHWEAVALQHQNLRTAHTAAVKLVRGYLVKTSPQESLVDIAVAFWGTKGFITTGGSIFSNIDEDSGFEVSVSDASDSLLRVSVMVDGVYFGFETPADKPVLDDTMALITVQAAEGWLSVHRNLEPIAWIAIPKTPRTVTADTPFTIGRRSNFPAGYQWNGSLEKVMVFKERIWRDQLAFLVNGGIGIEYRDLFEVDAGQDPKITYAASFADGEVGVAYSQEILFQNQTFTHPPILVEGSLPPGLSLNVDDLGHWMVTGDPTTEGSYAAYYTAQGRQEVVGLEIQITISAPTAP